MDYETRLKEAGLILPPPPQPVGFYHPIIIEGNRGYLSGQISRTGEGKILSGKIGTDLTVEEGKQAARIAALNVLSVIQHFVGFEKLGRILRVVGYVQVAENFYDIPEVVNGASHLFLQILEDKGIHARSAVGAASLPLNAAVELEVTVQLRG
ncbi:MAG: RidA family protein [Candidatus Omnitrophica bacterium]|nr:RidA family protein [Candidatus Omnitrophota bacterium]